MCADPTARGATIITDAQLARDAAVSAGELLLEIRGAGAVEQSADPSAVGVADERSDALLAQILLEHRPDDAILSEELASTGDRLGAERVWIIDPLDGTREYGEIDRDDWAVHVALWERGNLVAGCVAIPARHEVWSTLDEVGASASSGQPINRAVRRIAVSRTRPPRWAAPVAEALGAELVAMGSAGAKTAAVLAGTVDAYFHDGGQYEWDSAAPVVVAIHHGYVARRADGSELAYNQPDPYLPDLVVCPAGAAETVFGLIARHREEAVTAR